MKPAAEDDDYLPGLPPLDGANEEGEAELELPGEDFPEEEDVGLDTETGPTEGFAAEDFLDDIGEENERRAHDDWRVEGEPIGELEGEGQLLEDSGSEYGWTDDSEAPSQEEFEDVGIRTPDSESILGADSGEEGVEDDDAVGTLAEDDARNLPPLEPRELDDDSDAGEEDSAWLEPWTTELEREPEPSEIAAGQLDTSPFGVMYLGPSDDALVALAATPRSVFTAGDGLYELGPRGLSPARVPPLDDDAIVSIALHPTRPECLALGTRLGRVWCSTDRGGTFRAAKSLHEPPDTGGACYVTLEAGAGFERLWVRTRSGALFRSEDFGVSFVGPLVPFVVSALCADPTGGVVALCASHVGAAQIARSSDGGRRWEMRDVPFVGGVESGAPYGLAAHGRALVITKDGSAEAPLLSFDGGQRWERPPGLSRSGPVLFLEEAEGVVLYAAIFFEASDRGFIMRRAHDEESAVLDVARERAERNIELRGDSDGDNRVFALAGAHEDGVTVVFAATGAGLFQLRSAGDEQEP